MNALQHTEIIEGLLKLAAERQASGREQEADELRLKAQEIHNEHVAAELKRAESEPINLSDLMAARESFEMPR